MEASKAKISRGWLVGLGFLIVLLGIGAILFISNKAKCSVPTDSSGCPTGQVWTCTSDASDPVCAPVNTVCGTFSDTLMCQPTNCQYDKKQKMYTWQNCTPKGGILPTPTGTECTYGTDKKTLNYPVSIGSSIPNPTYLTPAAHYQKYMEMTLGGTTTCQLTECTDPYKFDSVQGLCVPPDDGLNDDDNNCTSAEIDKTYTKFPDSNAVFKFAYRPPATVGDEPVQYCTFSQCAIGAVYDGKTPGTCNPTKSDPNCLSSDYPTGGSDNHVEQWNYDGKSCYIGACTSVEYAIDPSNMTGKGAKCIPVCAADGTFTYTYSTSSGSCEISGCVKPGYTFQSDKSLCVADCTNQDVIKEVFGGVTPYQQSGFNYSIQPTTDGSCIPAPGNGDLFGGCGSPDYPMYALTNNGKNCGETVNAFTAKFSNGKDGSTRGCLACTPRYCPPGSTDVKSCTNAEDGCGYTSAKDTDITNLVTAENAVTFCMNNVEYDPSGNKGRYVWEVFGAYNTSDAYLDGTRKTSGSPTIFADAMTLLTNGKVIFGRTSGDANLLEVKGITPSWDNFQQVNDHSSYKIYFPDLSFGKESAISSIINRCIHLNLVIVYSDLLTLYGSKYPITSDLTQIYVKLNTGPSSGWDFVKIVAVSFDSSILADNPETWTNYILVDGNSRYTWEDYCDKAAPAPLPAPI
jgi:hypothetical protein